MNSAETKEYRRLKRAGYDVSKHPTFQFNHGSESIIHAFAKLVTAHVGLENGYNADCEIECPNGELDVLLFAPDKINRCVEIESNADDDVIADKKARYVDQSPVVDEIHVIEATELPSNVYDMRDRINTELGLYNK